MSASKNSEFFSGFLWCAGPWAGCRSRLKLPAGWEEADKGRSLWEGLLAQLHAKESPHKLLFSLSCTSNDSGKQAGPGTSGSIIANRKKPG